MSRRPVRTSTPAPSLLHHRTRLLLAVILPALLSIGGRAWAADGDIQEVWSKNYDLDFSNEPLAFDLHYDGNPEVVMTDNKGRIVVINGLTGDILWRQQVSKESFSAPVIGDFLGRGAQEILVGGSTGDLFVFDASSGKTMGQAHAGVVFAQPPSVVPFSTPPVAGMPVGGQSDAVVAIDDKGGIHCLQFQGSREVKELWSGKARTEIQCPAAVGCVLDPSRFNIVVGDYGGSVYVFDPLKPESAPQPWSLPPDRHIQSGIALGQLAGLENMDEILVSDHVGYLYEYSAEGGKRPDKPLYPPASIKGKTLKTLAAIDVQNDKTVDVLSAYELDLTLVDGLKQETQVWSATHPIATPPVLCRASDGNAYAFFFDQEGTLYSARLDTTDFWAKFPSSGEFTTSPVIFAGGQGRNIHVFAVQRNGGKASAFKTTLTSDQTNLWDTLGGSALRSGSNGETQFARVQAYRDRQQERLKAELAAAEAALAEGHWDEAKLRAGQALSIDPENASARAVIKRVTRRGLPLRIGLFLAIAGVGGWFGGRPAWRIATLRLGLRRAEKARQSGDLAEAERIYKRLLQIFPEDKDVNAQLAVLYMKQGDFSQETLPVFERVYGRNPDNAAVAVAMARACLNAGRRDEKAFEIYLKAEPLYDEPGPINHAIGATYLSRGDAQSALRHLRQASQPDYQPHELLLLLADAYVQTNARSASCMPAYEAAYSARPLDDQLLLAFAETCIAARRADAIAEEVYDKLLELRPDHNEARLMLARIRLRQGRMDEAIRLASRVLEADPEDAEALSVLAHGFMSSGRSDEEALTACRKALERFPNDTFLLMATARIYVERGERSPEARAIIRQAYASNPAEPSIQKAVCEIAAEAGDHTLVADAGWRLVETGGADPALWNRLATAHLRLGDRSDKAERAFREARVSEPDNMDWLEALSEIYSAADRRDPEALAAYDALRKSGRIGAAIGAQWLRGLLESGRLNECLAGARELIARFPGDEAIHRLLAKTSLESDQLDEAVRGYEEILARKPNDSEALIHLATAYARKSRLDETAMGLYSQAQEIEPENPLFSMMRARAAIQKGDWTGAAQVLKTVAGRGRPSAEAVLGEIKSLLSRHADALPLRWLAFNLSFTLGRNDEALQAVEALFEEDPSQVNQVLEAVERILSANSGNGMAHLQRGKMLKILGRFDEARSAMETALSLMPNEKIVQTQLTDLYEFALRGGVDPRKESDIRFSLGNLYLQLKNVDKAISCFQVTAQDFRFEAESTRKLGECFMVKGLLDLALQEFKKLHVDDGIKGLLYDLGQRYEQKSDLVGAKTVYRQLFAADISYRDVKDKFELLAGATSDPIAFEKTAILNQLSDKAKRRYELLEEIGRGAMGLVYRAHDNELQEIVALKILPDNLSNNPEAVRRFKAEARSARRLSHPHIVRIHDIGEEMGRKYISMEFVDGTDLKKRLRTDGVLPLDQLLLLAKQICSAMAYAHKVGIVHRDIKPANIMLTRDSQVKVTDFGIAKVIESAEATLAGAVIGTPLYMSPEQVQGLPADERADIYSLGILFYELFAGKPPFTQGDLAHQHLHVDPKPLKGCPEAFADFVARCLKKKKDERWQKVDEMSEALLVVG